MGTNSSNGIEGNKPFGIAYSPADIGREVICPRCGRLGVVVKHTVTVKGRRYEYLIIRHYRDRDRKCLIKRLTLEPPKLVPSTKQEFGKSSCTLDDVHVNNRCFRVLQVLVGDSRELTASELKRRTRLPRSTLNYCLNRLVLEGLVERVGDGGTSPLTYYRVTPFGKYVYHSLLLLGTDKTESSQSDKTGKTDKTFSREPPKLHGKEFGKTFQTHENTQRRGGQGVVVLEPRASSRVEGDAFPKSKTAGEGVVYVASRDNELQMRFRLSVISKALYRAFEKWFRKVPYHHIYSRGEWVHVDSRHAFPVAPEPSVDLWGLVLVFACVVYVLKLLVDARVLHRLVDLVPRPAGFVSVPSVVPLDKWLYQPSLGAFLGGT